MKEIQQSKAEKLQIIFLRKSEKFETNKYEEINLSMEKKCKDFEDKCDWEKNTGAER